jgi:hypothetical protein
VREQRSYRSVFNAMPPHATRIADSFHLVRLANAKLDECRRRVQNELFGHRGRKGDPLHRCRRLLTKAEEQLSDDGREKLLGPTVEPRVIGRAGKGTGCGCHVGGAAVRCGHLSSDCTTPRGCAPSISPSR